MKATGAVQKIFSHSLYGDANYQNKEDCDWIIEAPAGKNVHLSFLSFEMEDEQDCGYDYIEVFSGYDDAGPSYGRFCGNKVKLATLNQSLHICLLYQLFVYISDSSRNCICGCCITTQVQIR